MTATRIVPKGLGYFDIYADGYLIGNVANVGNGWGAQSMQAGLGVRAATKEAAAQELIDLVFPGVVKEK